MFINPLRLVRFDEVRYISTTPEACVAMQHEIDRSQGVHRLDGEGSPQLPWCGPVDPKHEHDGQHLHFGEPHWLF